MGACGTCGAANERRCCLSPLLLPLLQLLLLLGAAAYHPVGQAVLELALPHLRRVDDVTGGRRGGDAGAAGSVSRRAGGARPRGAPRGAAVAVDHLPVEGWSGREGDPGPASGGRGGGRGTACFRQAGGDRRALPGTRGLLPPR